MVYYSRNAIKALDNIFEGLLSWPKQNLSYGHVKSYHNERRIVCDSLDSLIYHFDVRFDKHKKYSKKAHCYNRKKIQVWI